MRLWLAAACLLSMSANLPLSAEPSCCEALESRIAELEAASALQSRSGATVKITGQLNRALLAWDDGGASDAYVTDNIFSSSRVIMAGKAPVAKGFDAGFVIEIEYRDAGSSTVSQLNDEGSDEANETGDSIRTRQALWYLGGDDYGRISAGQLSPATNSLIYYKLWTVTVNTSPDTLTATAFNLRNRQGDLTGLRWGALANALDTPRGDYVRYESPNFGGFVISGDAGENDAYDAALTFDKEWDALSVSAALGYFNAQDGAGAEDLRVSLLIKHAPTGLYAHAAAAERNFEAAGRETARLFYGHLGILAKIVPDGVTTVFGEYGRYDDFFAGRAAVSVAGLPELGGDGRADDFVAASTVERWGFGVMQNFDAAALEIYAHFNFFEANLALRDDDGPLASGAASLEPWTSVLLGSRIKF